MFHRLFLVVALTLAVAFSVEGFSPVSTMMKPAATSTALFASRVNAKKEKLKRNRENMRKFATPGRRGTSRRKILKKAQSAKARQLENEFIAKCFMTGPVPNEEGED